MSNEKRLFKSTIPSCKYIFKQGKEANFIKGRYITDIDSEIAELEAEIAADHPYIYIDDNAKTVSAEEADPMIAIRARMRAEVEEEYRQKLEAAKASMTPVIITPQTPLSGIANSDNLVKDDPANKAPIIEDSNTDQTQEQIQTKEDTQSNDEAQLSLQQKLAALKNRT